MKNVFRQRGVITSRLNEGTGKFSLSTAGRVRTMYDPASDKLESVNINNFRLMVHILLLRLLTLRPKAGRLFAVEQRESQLRSLREREC